jgi:SAM-dependent methyltransferase
MTTLKVDGVFAGSIPKLYETYLVPLIFEPYAVDLVNRLRSRAVSRLLEIAAGTGVVTRALASALPDDVTIVATDLNQAMLDQAQAVGTKRAVEWRQADAMQLPFQDGTFDAVVCQFGVMFFPDKIKAFSEIRRVLRPGGVLIFSVWDRLAENEFADTVTSALATVFPADPPRFMARTPHGYHDTRAVAAISRRADSLPRPRSRPSRLAVGPRPARSRRLRTARARGCETRSKPAMPRGSAKRPTPRPRPSPRGSAAVPSTERSRRTSSSSQAEVRRIRAARGRARHAEEARCPWRRRNDEFARARRSTGLRYAPEGDVP